MDQPGFIPQTNENVVEITPRTWNALADAVNAKRIGQSSTNHGTYSGWPPVIVANKTGSAINAPYRAFSIGEPVWTIGNNKLPDCCFELVAYDVTKPIAIIQQPLAVDEPGLAVVVGPTLVEVSGAGSTSDRKGSPNSSGIIVPGSGDKVQFANERPSGGGIVLALLGTGGSSAVTYAFPPSTGIPAATYNATTKMLTPGTAMCKLAIQDSTGVYKEGTESVLVENQIGTAVAQTGRPITIAMNKFGRWEIIVEDCLVSSNPNTNPDNPTPVPSPDPINEGTSKSLSLGYTLGV